jgi:hypothetical protein
MLSHQQKSSKHFAVHPVIYYQILLSVVLPQIDPGIPSGQARER